MATATTLPVLDLSMLDQGDEAAQAFREELRRVTHEVGFFYLTGHGVPTELIQRLLRVGREFFALPDDEKLAIENTNSPHFRGYTRMGGEYTQGKNDWREQLDIAAERAPVASGPGVEDYWVLQGPNLWPESLPELREVSEEWIEQLDGVSQRLMSAWAEALGAPADIFDEAFATMPTPHMKIARYPAMPEPESQGVGAHKDLGVLTLLYIEDGKGGLQVERDGEWIDAPSIPGAFVVNIGELLEIATDGYLKATMHRVVSPTDGDRLSFPYFYGPALDATIPTIELPAELKAHAPGVTRDPANPLHPIFGRNWLKSRLRAHPNVVEAHHRHLIDSPGLYI